MAAREPAPGGRREQWAEREDPAPGGEARLVRGGFVRAAPGGEALGVARRGDALVCTGRRRAGWIEVEYGEGAGWVAERFAAYETGERGRGG